MPVRPFPQSPAFKQVVSGLLRMHQYTVEGQDDSEEADALRQSMDEPWARLTAVERDRITGLSEDLYAITDPPDPSVPLPMNPQAQGKLNEAYEAREHGNWDRALQLLRRWGKYVPAPLLAYVRARIWDSAGVDQVAVLFFEQASRLDPGNENFRTMHLHALRWTDIERAKTIAEEVLHKSDTHSPALVIQAADVLFGASGQVVEHDAAPNYRRLIGILTPLLARTIAEDDGDRSWHVGNILFLLAACHRWLGDTPKAYEYYSRALALDPQNEGLLISRGVLGYGQYTTSISDFQQAIRLGSQSIWPYYFLAHDLLQHDRMDECRVMCVRALEKSGPPRVRSELHEFLGIAVASLDYPTLLVQRELEEAIRIDPSNERARHNLQAYLSSVEDPRSAVSWDRPSASQARGSGQPQRRTESVINKHECVALA